MIFFWKSKEDQKNHRKRDRVLCTSSVKLLVPSLASVRGEGYVEVRAKNISEGGVLIEATRSYPKLVPCRIKIDIQAQSKSITLEGMIIWADENASAASWEVGIAFVNVREEDRTLLQQFITQSR